MGRLMVGMFCVVGVLFLGVFFHVCENLRWYCGVVGLMWCMFISLFVICCSTCASSCGVCRLGVGLA